MKRQLFALLFLPALVVGAGAWGAQPKVEFKEGKFQIDVLIGGTLFTSYKHTPDPAKPLFAQGILQTKPALHPVHSPSGIVLTRGYPFVDVPGETRDHPHHMGIYFTMDNVGRDNDGFWGNSKAPLPAIRHVKVLRMKGGNGSGTLAVLSNWVGKSDKTLLEEEREMVFRAAGTNQIDIDFTMYLKALDQDITITDTKEGMFAFRVAEWLTEKAGGRYLNAEGDELEKGVWGKRSNWVRLQGEKDGKKLGIAILNHPTSTNSPTYWHARGYGCFSVNPLGQLDFQKAQKLPEAKPLNLKIKAGEKALFKYRVSVYEGEMDRAKMESQYKAFAK